MSIFFFNFSGVSDALKEQHSFHFNLSVQCETTEDSLYTNCRCRQGCCLLLYLMRTHVKYCFSSTILHSQLDTDSSQLLYAQPIHFNIHKSEGIFTTACWPLIFYSTDHHRNDLNGVECNHQPSQLTYHQYHQPARHMSVCVTVSIQHRVMDTRDSITLQVHWTQTLLSPMILTWCSLSDVISRFSTSSMSSKSVR